MHATALSNTAHGPVATRKNCGGCYCADAKILLTRSQAVGFLGSVTCSVPGRTPLALIKVARGMGFITEIIGHLLRIGKSLRVTFKWVFSPDEMFFFLMIVRYLQKVIYMNVLKEIMLVVREGGRTEYAQVCCSQASLATHTHVKTIIKNACGFHNPIPTKYTCK